MCHTVALYTADTRTSILYERNSLSMCLCMFVCKSAWMCNVYTFTIAIMYRISLPDFIKSNNKSNDTQLSNRWTVVSTQQYQKLSTVITYEKIYEEKTYTVHRAWILTTGFLLFFHFTPYLFDQYPGEGRKTAKPKFPHKKPTNIWFWWTEKLLLNWLVVEIEIEICVVHLP